MAESLHTKYRPKTFDEVIAQDSVVKILKRQIEINRFPHCYLFCGETGAGKTSLARIVANAINKGVGSPIEIDAASNSGVDNAREIVASASERSLEGKYKIYIFDEAHAFGTAAFQVLLKCIEEPPEFTIFMFCTTDPQKIPQTIINRCQRFDIKKAKPQEIYNRLKYVCIQEGFEDFDDGIDYISRICGGSIRQSLSMLEKCAGYSNQITANNVLASLGRFGIDSYFSLINGCIDGDDKTVLKVVYEAYQNGTDIKLFVDQFISFCLDIDKYALFGDFSLLQLPQSAEESIKKCINFDNAPAYYSWVLDKLLDLKQKLKGDSYPKETVEIALLQIARCK
jgi:DNA polymerase-3 subunit gamma/tau